VQETATRLADCKKVMPSKPAQAGSLLFFPVRRPHKSPASPPPTRLAALAEPAFSPTAAAATSRAPPFLNLFGVACFASEPRSLAWTATGQGLRSSAPQLAIAPSLGWVFLLALSHKQ
jgi:hypothetical protein